MTDQLDLFPDDSPKITAFDLRVLRKTRNCNDGEFTTFGSKVLASSLRGMVARGILEIDHEEGLYVFCKALIPTGVPPSAS